MARPDSLARPAAAVARNVSGSKKIPDSFCCRVFFCPGKGQDVSYGNLIAAQWGLHVRVFVGEAYLGIFQLVQYFHVLI